MQSLWIIQLDKFYLLTDRKATLPNVLRSSFFVSMGHVTVDIEKISQWTIITFCNVLSSESDVRTQPPSTTAGQSPFIGSGWVSSNSDDFLATNYRRKRDSYLRDRKVI